MGTPRSNSLNAIVVLALGTSACADQDGDGAAATDGVETGGVNDTEEGTLGASQSGLSLFATHHATPEGGVFPERGGDGEPRQFVNSEDWEVTLQQAYLTVSAVSVVSCDGAEIPLEMLSTPRAEDLLRADLTVLQLAQDRVPAGTYCSLKVEYGPYQTPTFADGAKHQVPDIDDVEGATVYLTGSAQLDGEPEVPFQIRSTQQLVVELDTSQLGGPGAPLNLGMSSDFRTELTISNTYDRFFDGVDFGDWDPAALEADLLSDLAERTRLQEGTIVAAP